MNMICIQFNSATNYRMERNLNNLSIGINTVFVFVCLFIG
jgi:hypothetical protein